MKKIYLLFLISLLTSCNFISFMEEIAPGPTSGIDNNNINGYINYNIISDPYLRTAIESLGYTYTSDITYLELGGYGISHLDGMEQFTSLTYLYLWGNYISDLSPLTDLTSLLYLDLAANTITDVYSLSNLYNLQYLYLDNNIIQTGVSSLTNFTSLSYISLTDNPYLPLEELIVLINLYGTGIVNY